LEEVVDAPQGDPSFDDHGYPHEEHVHPSSEDFKNLKGAEIFSSGESNRKVKSFSRE